MKKYILIFQIIFVLLYSLTAVCFSADTTVINTENTKEKLVGVEANFTSDGFYYIYYDRGSRLNHKVPGGWMGDYRDINLDDKCEDNPQNGKTCMQWSYSTQGKEGWGGVCWQTPMGWYHESREGRLDLRKAKRLTLWARGETGEEKIKIQIGGMGVEFPDSDSKISDIFILSKDWQKFALDLEDVDMACISNIFSWLTDKQMNPDGCVFYLDNIRYEK